MSLHQGLVTASSEDFEGKNEFVNDGNTDGEFSNRSVSHTKIEQDPWIEVDLGEVKSIDRVALWNRIHDDPAIEQRLKGFRVSLLNEDRCCGVGENTTAGAFSQRRVQYRWLVAAAVFACLRRP